MTAPKGLRGRARAAVFGVARRGVDVLARVPGAERLAKEVAAQSLKNSAPMDIRPGRFFAPGTGRSLPIVVIVATGLGEGDSELLAREIEHAQFTTGAFRPLVVVDNAELAPLRARDFAVEHLMPQSAFEAVNPYDSWSEYVFDRVASIARSYRAQSVVPLPAGQPLAVARHLLRLIGTAHPAP